MALTRPRFGQLNTSVVAGADPITVLHAGASTANVDVGFLMNRANGLVSNVALYWNETGNTFVTAFTSNTGITDTNVAVTTYAPITTGNHISSGTVIANAINAGTIGNVGATHTGSTLTLTSYANIAGPLVVTNNTAVQAIQVAGTSTKGGAGYHDFLLVTNQGGGTNPNKTFRLNSIGGIEIINSAYTSNLFTLTDGGDLTIPGKITVNALYTTTGLFWAGNNNVISSGGGGSAPAGSTGQVQYNNGGALGASSLYYYSGNSSIVATGSISSTSTASGTFQVLGGIGISGNVWAGQVYATNNGNGTNFAVGDDAWIGDINIANTMGIKGQQDPTQGYVVFGNANNTNYIGRNGSNPITVTGAFSITGNTAISSTMYAQGVYDNGTRVVSTSTGAGNLTISGNAINLPSSGPGATSVGSSTAIPVITTDAYGRIASTLTAAVVAPAGTLSGTTLNSTVTASSLTSVGTLTGLTVSGAPVPNANASVNLGSTSAYWNNLYAATAYHNSITVGAQGITPTTGNAANLGTTTNWFNNIYGTAIHALYADLAENYTADGDYLPGTVVIFGGDKEITVTTTSHDPRVAGVISTNPAYLMNGASPGLPVAFTGRVPCQVLGPVTKGQVLVTSTTAGVAEAIDNSQFLPGCVVGKALEAINTNTIQTIEVVVGRF